MTATCICYGDHTAFGLGETEILRIANWINKQDLVCDIRSDLRIRFLIAPEPKGPVQDPWYNGATSVRDGCGCRAAAASTRPDERHSSDGVRAGEHCSS